MKEIESNETLEEIAKKVKCGAPYLSQLKKKSNPQIRASYIANFCEAYNFSPTWIITGKGNKKLKIVPTKEDKLIEIIADLIDALLELKPQWTSATKELVHESKKRVQ